MNLMVSTLNGHRGGQLGQSEEHSASRSHYRHFRGVLVIPVILTIVVNSYVVGNVSGWVANGIEAPVGATLRTSTVAALTDRKAATMELLARSVHGCDD